MTAAVIALLATQTSGAAGAGTPSADSRAQGSDSLRVSAPEKCPSARKGLRWYRGRYAEHRAKMGATAEGRAYEPVRSCPRVRYLAKRWRTKAYAARVASERWHDYHYDWPSWLPDKWQRIGACETGYGRRPGDWRWNSGTYQGAFGFYHGSWDAFVGSADRKAGPYPANAYDATPRQQYEVALAIWRRYGFSGWGCRGA